MSYFGKIKNNKKASSDIDGVFSIFLQNNNSSDDMQIHDDIIMAIKEYYSISEFSEKYIPMLEEITAKIFKEPNVPNMVSKTSTNKPEASNRENKFASKYKL